MIKMFSAILLVIGGLNWGIYGLFSFDAVGWICGGSTTLFAKIIFTLVGLAAIVFTVISLAEHSQNQE